MTKPISKALGDKLRLVDYWDQVRVHSPKAYAKHMQQQQEIFEQNRFIHSAEGRAMYDEIKTFFAEQQWESPSAERRTKRYKAEYTLLGVQPGASQQEIKRAYRQKARALHPDKGGSEAEMKRLNAAYQKLLAKSS